MAAALRALGTSVTDAGADWAIAPGPLRGGSRSTADWPAPSCGSSLRLAALADGDVAFDGDPRSHERPMRPLVESLRALGVDIDDAGRATLPFVVRGHGSVKGGTVSLDASASSQFVSGLLLAAPRFDEGIEVRHVGEPGALGTAPADERRDAPGCRRHRRRRDARRVAGRSRTAPRRRPRHRARPVERRPVPRGGSGHRRTYVDPGLADLHHPGRRRPARPALRDGRARSPSTRTA